MNYDGMDLDPLLRSAFGRVPRTTIKALFGQASSRRYYRLTLQDRQGDEPETLVVMRLPQDATRSDEGGGAEAPEDLPFLTVAEFLRAREIRIPQVYADDLSRLAVLLEDLGDESFEDRLLANPDSWTELYSAAIDRLVEIHERCHEVAPNHIISTRRFDHELLRWELDHFREWGLEALIGEFDERAEMDRLFEELTVALVAHPQGFVHRDYQSRNLMWKNDELVLIDFQDAMRGPRVYDLVALLCDSYVSISEDLQRAMVRRYASARGIDGDTLEAEFWEQAIQRKLKDAGRFIYIDRVRKNPSFLVSFPQSIEYVRRALKNAPRWSAIDTLLKKRLPGYPDSVTVPESQA